MKKKIFNYFLKKVLLKEQELLKTKDEQLALLAVIFSSTHVFRRYQSGCNMEQIYFAEPKYAEELFLLVCLDAEQHGDHLLGAFNFVPKEQFCRGSKLPDLNDAELSNYLDKEVYPIAKAVDYDLYAALMNTTAAEAQEKIACTAANYMRATIGTDLELPNACSETEMIDRAWSRLLENGEFVKLLQIAAKHDKHGISEAYKRYVASYTYLLQHI